MYINFIVFSNLYLLLFRVYVFKILFYFSCSIIVIMFYFLFYSLVTIFIDINEV